MTRHASDTLCLICCISLTYLSVIVTLWHPWFGRTSCVRGQGIHLYMCMYIYNECLHVQGVYVISAGHSLSVPGSYGEITVDAKQLVVALTIIHIHVYYMYVCVQYIYVYMYMYNVHL